MTRHLSWQYDEMKHIGRDYADPSEVDIYDSRHAQFRDVEQENGAILDLLGLKPEHVLLDLGAGTAALAIQAARRCARVYAVDISQAMLDFSKRKADEAGIANIVFLHGGFLSYDHDADPVDAIVTCVAFHHLPDFWKGIALHRMKAMLKEGGKLYISDVIFDEHDAVQNIDGWIDRLSELGGETLRGDMKAHLREEYSTYDWIMDGLLTRAGFRIETKNMRDGVLCGYLCAKEGEA